METKILLSKSPLPYVKIAALRKIWSRNGGIRLRLGYKTLYTRALMLTTMTNCQSHGVKWHSRKVSFGSK